MNSVVFHLDRRLGFHALKNLDHLGFLLRTEALAVVSELLLTSEEFGLHRCGRLAEIGNPAFV